jgi:hypothetical protein
VHFEPAGLRITLPREYAGPPGFFGERPDTGVAVAVGVKGDFEITVSYEILQEPEPEDAGLPQTRISLDLGVDRATNTVTVLSRRVEKTGGAQFLAWVSVWKEADGKNDSAWKEFPALAKTGRLRIVRTGAELSYYAAEGPKGEFVLLQRCAFSPANLEDVRLTGSTGGARAALDVRLTDLSIRAESLQKTTEPGTRQTGPRNWLAISFAFTLVLALALGLLLAVRRGRRPARAPSPAALPGQEAGTRVAPASISFPCSGCGKALKAQARLAGKRAKCPNCGKAVLVTAARPRSSPATRTDGSRGSR